MQSVVTAFSASASDKLGGLTDSTTAPLSANQFNIATYNAPPGGVSAIPAPLSIPVMQFAIDNSFCTTATGLQYLPAGTWYDTGVRQPFDFAPLIHAPPLPNSAFYCWLILSSHDHHGNAEVLLPEGSLLRRFLMITNALLEIPDNFLAWFISVRPAFNISLDTGATASGFDICTLLGNGEYSGDSVPGARI